MKVEENNKIILGSKKICWSALTNISYANICAVKNI